MYFSFSDTDHMNYDCMLTKLRCVSNTSPPARKVDYQPIMSCAFAKKEKHGHILAAVYQQGYITAVDTRSQNGQNADSPPLYCGIFTVLLKDEISFDYS